jgi:hypothetical protein
VAWTSTDPDVAAVDSATGLVTANSAGSVDIIARVEGKAGRARITVARATPAEPRPADDAILAGVAACYDAVRSRDIERLAAMYSPETDADRDKLRKLSRILQTDEWSAAVGEKVNGERQIGQETAAMDFSFQLTWKDAFGGRLSSEPTLRAEFRRSGARWQMSSCRLVGSPRL